MKPATVRRWDAQFSHSGAAGLLAERKGPKRKSKLTDDTVASMRGLRDGGASYRAIAAETGLSQGSIRAALVLTDGDADADVDADELAPQRLSGWSGRNPSRGTR